MQALSPVFVARRAVSVARFLSLFGLTAACLACGIGDAAAQIRLTEVVTNGTDAAGGYIAPYDWHTASLPSGAYNLWLIEGTNLNGAFLNGPDRARSDIDLPLSVGDHTYTIYASASFNRPDTTYYGINLGFNGMGEANNTFTGGPQISAYAPAYNGSSTNFVANGNSVRYFDTVVTGANMLSFSSGGFTATLVEFFDARRDYSPYANINRVSDYTTSPGGEFDNIGRFTLRVTSNAAPEPGTLALLGLGLLSGSARFAAGRRPVKRRRNSPCVR